MNLLFKSILHKCNSLHRRVEGAITEARPQNEECIWNILSQGIAWKLFLLNLNSAHVSLCFWSTKIKKQNQYLPESHAFLLLPR